MKNSEISLIIFNYLKTWKLIIKVFSFPIRRKYQDKHFFEQVISIFFDSFVNLKFTKLSNSSLASEFSNLCFWLAKIKFIRNIQVCLHFTLESHSKLKIYVYIHIVHVYAHIYTCSLSSFIEFLLKILTMSRQYGIKCLSDLITNFVYNQMFKISQMLHDLVGWYYTLKSVYTHKLSVSMVLICYFQR